MKPLTRYTIIEVYTVFAKHTVIDTNPASAIKKAKRGMFVDRVTDTPSATWHITDEILVEDIPFSSTLVRKSDHPIIRRKR